jgi:hypothetical protein
MNGKRAKLLRKQANYKKTRTVKVIGDYNINLGYTILNVPKTEVQEISDIEKSSKKLYKDLKKDYKSI